MQTNARIYPKWTSKILVPSGTMIQYKYLVAKSFGRNIIRWEVLPYKYNRSLTVPNYEAITIFEIEGMYERSIEYVDRNIARKQLQNMMNMNTKEVGAKDFMMNEIDEEGITLKIKIHHVLI